MKSFVDSFKQETQGTQPGLPIAQVAGFAFRLDLFAGADLSDYEVGAGDRIILLYLIGEIEHEFSGSRADEFYTWFMQLTGQAKIQQVDVGGLTY